MPPSLSIVEIYESRLGARRATVSALERRSFRFSLVRVAIAASAGVILFAGGLAAAWWVLAPVVLFLAAMVRHAKLLNRIDRARSAAAFYERGLARIRGAWAGQGRPGDRLQPPDHVFAEALDLFGRGTLFDLLSTVRTDAGEETLAGWLLAPASPDRARIRQAAVKELSGLLDLREAMAVAGDVVRQGVSAARVRSWATTPIHLRGTLLRIVIGLVVATSAALMGWYFFTGALGPMWLAVLALQGLIAMRFRSAVHDVTHAIDEPARELEVLAELLRVLERERFENATLVTLQQQIGGERRPASAAIRRLSQHVAWLSAADNFYFALPAAFLLWTTQWAFVIEAWRAEEGRHLPRWLDGVGEFEALVALATFAAEHPDYIYPEFVDGPARLAAAALAHPAMPARAVANDVALGGGAPALLIVSGSNMSGKSTLLRAIGLNIVLANAGGPVRARRFEISRLDVGAAINIQDSLADGRSRFYAEIQRLKQVVDLVQTRQGHVLFLFDEIFSGTNSHDRRIGADALLTGLISAGAVGLATTHDLAIGEIADRLAPAAANVHFDDHLQDGRLTFDYTLKPGIVRTSNALELMRAVGLRV